MNIDPVMAVYYIFMLAYLGLFVVIIVTLGGMLRALKRVADRMEAQASKPE